jgi:ribosomal protein L11 methyltransferase
MTENEGYWTEIALRVKQGAYEFAADQLQEMTGNAVSIEPPIEALGPDEGYLLDQKAPWTIKGYVRGGVPQDARDELRRLLDAAGLVDVIEGEIGFEAIKEEDWAEAWKAHYDIEKVGKLLVRPAWREYEAQPGDVVITLDPGMAFGTGQHPTTRMCMQALQDRMHSGDYVLDLGSGSGILAIAAIALGASSVLATDTEEQAVSSTTSNVALNAMEDRIETRPGSIDAVGDNDAFDCIMANINAAAVTSLAQAMADKLKPGGWLAAGGVIAEREPGARSALEAAGLRIEETLATGDWRTFIAYKP